MCKFSCYVGLISPVDSSKQLIFETICEGVYPNQKYKMIAFSSLRLKLFLSYFDYERYSRNVFINMVVA